MKNKQVMLGTLLSYGAIGFNVIAGLLYTPWMIQSVGADQYALYTLALTIMNLFMIDFGFSASVTKYLSDYYARGEQDKADRFSVDRSERLIRRNDILYPYLCMIFLFMCRGDLMSSLAYTVSYVAVWFAAVLLGGVRKTLVWRRT